MSLVRRPSRVRRGFLAASCLFVWLTAMSIHRLNAQAIASAGEQISEFDSRIAGPGFRYESNRRPSCKAWSHLLRSSSQ